MPQSSYSTYPSPEFTILIVAVLVILSKCSISSLTHVSDNEWDSCIWGLLEVIITYYTLVFYKCSLHIIFKQTIAVIITLDNSLG